MTQTAFSKQVEILGTFWLFYREDALRDEGWAMFFNTQDVGLPLSYMLWQGLAVEQADAIEYIDSTWAMYCDLIGIDPEGDYDSLDATFAASPHDSIPEEEED